MSNVQVSTRGLAIAPRAKTKTAPSPIAIAVSPSSLAGSPPSTMSLVSQIQTSKEWVLPPRPKPGRKPSVDTPASKRKAQNRAAQRAFRERRATRVQELEEKLAEVEKERDIKEMGLINTINKLKVENQFLLKNLESLRADVAGIRNTKSSPNPSPSSSTYSVQQISPAPSADSPPNIAYRSAIHPTPISNDPTPNKPTESSDFDCGVCIKDECLCEDVGLKGPSTRSTLTDLVETFKPVAAVPLKRKASTMEIDFTKQYGSSKHKPLPDMMKLKKHRRDIVVQDPAPKKIFDEGSPVDNCGFCTDDTPCVCREAAKEAAKISQSMEESKAAAEEDEEEEDKLLPPIQNSTNIRKASLPVMHPGPSVEIRDITNLNTGTVPPVVSHPVDQQLKPSGCTGNPGQCEQCQMDPLSTLFCSTVANKAKESNERAADRQSDSSSTRGSITRTDSRSSIPMALTSAPSTPGRSSTPSVPGSNGIFIPCADAYKTLSRHKQFNSVDFSTLVGKLTTRGMQVEVQSVANVLRELDRRVYN